MKESGKENQRNKEYPLIISENFSLANTLFQANLEKKAFLHKLF